MILLQSALASRKGGWGRTWRKPGAELLRAIDIAQENEIPVELIDRDINHAEKGLEEHGITREI